MVEHQQVLNFNYTYKATDDFKNVPNRKAAKLRKIELGSPIKTANKFNALLNVEDQEMQCNVVPPREIVPAINLKITDDYNLTLQEISRNFPETDNHYVRGYIRISPNSSEVRTKIIEYLDKNEKEYVLSEAPTERPIKIVIKGVPPDHCREKITQELESLNFKVIRINHLRNYRLKTLHPIVLVELAKTSNVEEIFKINKVNLLKVTIEAYRKKQRATMCYNCSDFYHSSRNCKRKPRCIKCNGSHETRNCNIKTIIENPSCINCNEKGHLASWRGCPKFPVIKINKTPTQLKCWGIKGKFRELKYVIDEKQPDIVALQETHLNPGVKLTIPNCTTYRNDRLTHRGGGTALLIKNSINHHPTPVFTSTFENISVSIDLPNNNSFTISSIYHPHHGRIDSQDLNNLFNISLKGIEVGDFNAKHPASSQGRSNINGSIIHNHIANSNLVLLAPLEPTNFPYHHPSSVL
ncbi:Nucleic-acid-binding protein from transposon X-element [Araneus ventricosus]|uniref:Nucleic-acid-binding protein from transposon X-element n=1 Tax=Araneus ventricosus TaxID=182803 RepID=A0A4Y2RS56_ARAVE|nr:Nucleic-acid-binding protein from transposon X-element [Araneus ventricosus]